jgi:pilus assembly protein CpaB
MQGTLSATPSSYAASPHAGDKRIVVAALLMGAVAAVLIVAYLRNLESRAGPAEPTLSVVVAAREIAVGQKFTDGMIELKGLPETAVVSGAATAKDQVVGQVARYPLAKGEQINASRLVEPAKVPALSFQIPPGLRGFTIPMAVTKSPAALVAPGDFVDVLVAFDVQVLGLRPPSTQGDPSRRGDTEFHAAVTLIQNAQVLSVQRQFAEGTGVYEPATRAAPPKESNVTYVTLAVKPEDTQLLALAIDKAKLLTLSLRGFGDAETPELRPIPEWQLLTPATDPLQQRSGPPAQGT